MLIQIRYTNGDIRDAVINDDLVTLDSILTSPGVEKISFDFTGGSRLALRTDGTYQIFGGLINYPRIGDL